MIKKFVFFVLCIVCTNTLETGLEFRKDYSYDHKAKGWLKLHPMPTSWLAARTQCYYEGAILASPLNKGLWEAITNVIQKDNTNPDFIFSGVHSNYVEGIYTTVEGERLENLHILWAPNEPQYVEGQACIVYESNGTMSNKKCEERYPYICYKKLTTHFVSSYCGTVDRAYEYREETGSCYKFHSVGQTWLEAFAICNAEGGHLAVIDHLSESAVLQDIIANYPQKIKFSDHPNSVSIGFIKQNGWWTIHGVPLQDAKYMVWRSGSPNLHTDRETCGTLVRNEGLDDELCNSKSFAFICEMPVGSLMEVNSENVN